jgi:hypothetical protein
MLLFLLWAAVVGQNSLEARPRASDAPGGAVFEATAYNHARRPRKFHKEGR